MNFYDSSVIQENLSNSKIDGPSIYNDHVKDNEKEYVRKELEKIKKEERIAVFDKYLGSNFSSIKSPNTKGNYKSVAITGPQIQDYINKLGKDSIYTCNIDDLLGCYKYLTELVPIENKKYSSGTQSALISSYIKAIIAYAMGRIEYKDKPLPLQTIFYGSPGCGKSHEVKELLKNNKIGNDDQFRTTFHPDSDYYSFVGSYKPNKNGDSITYGFSPQVFTKAYIQAWKNPVKGVVLIIEEINRGNCAQIFGDLFQLLDRDSNGYSEYPIDADEDLKQYLEENLGVNNEGIKGGKLKLPPNLYIIATMNTSDQSLFPMDSAFKRRWAWKHVPINYNSNGSKFDINIGNKSFPWNTFLKQINYKIYDVTKSEDKMLGNFFIKGDVDEEEFVEKVMFYLWNDVLKMEYAIGNNSFFKYKTDGTEETFKFSDLFGENKSQILTGFMEYLEVKPKEDD